MTHKDGKMVRSLIVGLLLLVPCASMASAQEWARKMFKEVSHDFGTVARGSKQIFEFELQNIYKEDIHISRVRASCGCTIPSIKKHDLKTWETGAIIAEYNTRSFLGKRGATVTVTIDKPFPAEVQLTVKGYIRSDVTFSPALVQFGDVESGHAAEQRITVNHSGRSSWKITDVRSGNPHLEVRLNEKARAGNRVTYDMFVKLKQGAPVGYLQDQLTIVTDDNQRQTVSVAVEGRVNSALSVSPATVFLGALNVGQVAEKKLVVRGKKPFKIVAVRCNDARFTFETSESAKMLHLLPMKFTADSATGKVSQTVVIETDQGATAECIITGDLTGAVAGN
ncbi:MAG: hypothetical protein CL681_28565 [Blastopirellula sp.]|nr:hypothetical protein [Blastopirellula sp.]